jgi:hypothetical protein
LEGEKNPKKQQGARQASNIFLGIRLPSNAHYQEMSDEEIHDDNCDHQTQSTRSSISTIADSEKPHEQRINVRTAKETATPKTVRLLCPSLSLPLNPTTPSPC